MVKAQSGDDMRCEKTMLIRIYPYIAGFCGVVGLFMLFVGLGLAGILPLPRSASAGDTRAASGLSESVVSRQQAALLQSTVDGAVISLGGLYAADNAAEDEADSPAADAPAGVLGALTFELGSEVAFTAWEGTRMVYSPTTPDAEGMDFADAQDGRGIAFVQLMAEAADNGGGFLQVDLPRMMPRQGAVPPKCRAVRGGEMHPHSVAEDGMAPETAGSVDILMPEGESGVCILTKGPGLRLDKAPVPQVVYVRPLPYGEQYVAAFMPVDSTAQPLEELFSSAVFVQEKQRVFEARDSLGLGLSVSGFSLAALAGLVFTPASLRRRHERKNGCSAE